MVSKKISKKLIIYLYVALVLSLVIILVLLNIESFKETTKRFMEVFNITNVKCFFEAYLDAFIIYFCLSKLIGIGQKALEKRFSQGVK